MTGSASILLSVRSARRPPALRALLIVCAFSAALLASPAVAAGATERVSLTNLGAQANSASEGAALSADGRFVAFSSYASNLVAGDSNNGADIFVRDRQNGTTERVSIATGGAQGDGESFHAAISADGRHIAFASHATNLVPGDTNGLADVFVHDRQTGTTERISIATGGEPNDSSLGPSISADGRYVAFYSAASNLVPGDTNGTYDVFVHDRQTGITETASVASDGAHGNDFSIQPAISADGRHVAFHSGATNLAANDTNDSEDVFVHDRQTGTTEMASIATDGAQANNHSIQPAISADGRHVAFTSEATNLAADDTNASEDVFVHDRQTGTTEWASFPRGEDQGSDNGYDSEDAAISADGRYVAFESWAPNLDPDDEEAWRDIFVHDRQTGAIKRVSVAGNGERATDNSSGAAISADGRLVAFSSLASNLVAGDSNKAEDVFVHDRGGAPGAACSDGLDNDGDGLADFPADGGCASAQDASETPRNACSDGIDNDADGQTDHPSDPGCTSPTDNNETNARCNDGIDNDGDGLTDHPADPGCTSQTDNNETNARCDDGIDNDGDGLTDHPADPGCTSPADNNEANQQCNDGIDNDGDGATDHPADPGCDSRTDNNETNKQCDDGLDNDGDGATDHPADPGCTSPTDNNETNARCNDGIDNDGDGAVDHPADLGCTSPTDNKEDGPAGGPPPPDPRTVSVSTDSSIEDTQVVGPDGGTLRVTKNAVEYRLSIPSGALGETHTITMRPVVALSGFDLTGPPVAIQLEPDGLYLIRPATLEVSTTAPGGLPADLTSFAWHGSGDQFHLYPPSYDPNGFDPQVLRFDVWHFSGYGAAPATDAAREEQAAHRPTSPGDQRAHDLERHIRDARKCQGSGGTDCDAALNDALLANLLASYPATLAAVNAASTDNASAAAIAAALSWMRAAELLGVTSLKAQQEALIAAIHATVGRAYDRAWALCKEQSSARQGLSRLVAHLRAAILLGAASEAQSNEAFDQTRLNNCIAWSVSFQSSFEHHGVDEQGNSYSRSHSISISGLKVFGLQSGDALSWPDKKAALNSAEESFSSAGRGSRRTVTGEMALPMAAVGIADDLSVQMLRLRLPSHASGLETTSEMIPGDGPQSFSGIGDVPWTNRFVDFHSDLVYESGRDHSVPVLNSPYFLVDLPLENGGWESALTRPDAHGHAEVEESRATLSWAGGE